MRSRVLGLVGPEELAERPISEIAYGEKRRVEIAMALAQKPKVLLLDEPPAGLSSAERNHDQEVDRRHGACPLPPGSGRSFRVT